jgi:hypothetical protein
MNTLTLADYELGCYLALYLPPYILGGYWAYMLHH